MATKANYLETSASRNLSLITVARLSDEEAEETLRHIRWAETGGEPVCPHCGAHAYYRYNKRKLWRCKVCDKQYSVTSKTLFHSSKLPARDLLVAVALFVNCAKGKPALQLSRELNRSYKAIWVLLHKLRETLTYLQENLVIIGEDSEVAVDGAYFGGYVKPANHVEKRRDRRKLKNQSGKRQVLMCAREIKGKHARTKVFVAPSEAGAVPILEQLIPFGTIVHADELPHYDRLHYSYEARRINHNTAFSYEDACTNSAESFFSRVRRSEFGVHHHIAGDYLDHYGSEMAWREDVRRVPNGDQFLMLLTLCLTLGPTKRMTNQWGKKRAN